MKHCSLLLSVLSAALVFQASQAFGLVQPEAQRWHPERVEGVEIRIDGRLDEEHWQKQDGWKTFLTIEPGTLSEPPSETNLRLLYSDKGLYVGVHCSQPADTLVSRITGRDVWVSRDFVTVVVDPTGKGLFAYWFGVALGGSLNDGTVLPERNFTSEWDGPWRGASAVEGDGWSVEFFLPWSMMSLPPAAEGGGRDIGVYVSRSVAQANELWAWPGLPPSESKFITALQKVRLEKVEAEMQLDLYPYASALYDLNEKDFKLRFGAEGFWRPFPGLQLVGTLNPSFGAVESDDVVVNLSTLESFFPEKRAFFLEGRELFIGNNRAGRGGNTVSLVNTRRIGRLPGSGDLPDELDLDDSLVQEPVDLYGALRLSGQSGSWRYGLFGAFERDADVRAIDDEDQRQIFSRPGRNYGAFRAFRETQNERGKLGIGWLGAFVDKPDEQVFTQGIDAHYFSAGGGFRVDSQLLHSHLGGEEGFGVLADLSYVPKSGHRHSLDLGLFDDKLEINDFGFLRRNDEASLVYRYQISQFSVPGLQRRQTDFTVVQKWNLDGRLVRSGFFAGRQWVYNSLNRLRVEAGLFPARWEDLESGDNGVYRVETRGRASVEWGSNESKDFSFNARYQLMGEDIGGMSQFFRSGVYYRPGALFSLSAELRYNRRRGWLLHDDGVAFTTFAAEEWRPSVSIELLFSNRQRLSAKLNWVGIRAREDDYYESGGGGTARHLLAVEKAPDAEDRSFYANVLTWQLRYRWEIAPLSDLFIVYTRGLDDSGDLDRGFTRLFREAVEDPVVSLLALQLRYRFGV